jgi:hypothetical protein
MGRVRLPLLGGFAERRQPRTVRVIEKEPAVHAVPHAHRPASSFFQFKQRSAAQPLRAQLDGLEVQESTFGEWLAAGGDRRSALRPQRDTEGLGRNRSR